MKPRKEGCEIEARRLTYKIHIPRRTHRFKIWSRDVDDAGGVDGAAGKAGGEVDLEQPPPSPEANAGAQVRRRHVLKDVSCRAKPWEVLAIVGPSGAGKSSLLEILAGKLVPPGEPPAVFVDQKPLDPVRFRKVSGYVTQKDVLFPLLTVRETLLFSAQLRLRCSSELAAAKVESLIRELGLERVAGVRIGDERVRGVSGGERRRVSIGVEVIHDPRVLILDEPTSGLDSTSALQIVDMLKAMAEVRGRTVVLSIHQPGFRIVKLFSSVLLLAGGEVLHQGSVDQLQAHLRTAGLEVPLHVNVVEFAIDSIDALRQQRQRRRRQQQLTLQETPPQQQQQQSLRGEGGDGRRDRCTLQQLFQLSKVADVEALGGSGHRDVGAGAGEYYANSRLAETAILTHRYLKNVFRTKELFACRTIQMLASGLVLGSIFHDLRDDAAGARERVGLFAFVLTFLLGCTTEALPIFLQEREILLKETSAGSYRVSSYAMANGLVFLPFLLTLAVLFAAPLYWLVGLRRCPAAFAYFVLLIWLVLYTANSVVACFGALAPNFIVGNSMISGTLGAFFLFSGYFIRKEQMPGYWVFMHYVSLFKYPLEGFLVNEFSDPKRCLEFAAGTCLVNGEEVLRQVGLAEDGRWRNVAIMVGFILAYRFFSYLILRCRCRCAQRGGLKGALSSSG